MSAKTYTAIDHDEYCAYIGCFDLVLTKLNIVPLFISNFFDSSEHSASECCRLLKESSQTGTQQ